MKYTLSISFLILFVLKSFSQSSADAAVRIDVVTQSSPAQITLNWPVNATTLQYQVFRKLKTDTQWGSALAVLSATTNQYVDNTVAPGTNYEYRIIRNGTNYTAYGYINSGIEVPEISHRGKLILIVDSTMIVPLAAELERYIQDVEGDGWEVIRHDVLRTGSVTHVKDFIIADYTIDSAKIKAVFLVGHVPVPYSGNINPDGHSDHLGAWPADCYYGDVDGTWTDLFVTSTMASPARTQNIPGDGKFDQSVIPTDLELQVGRADFANMSAFALSETQLLKNYFDKDHEYRKKIYVPIKQAVIDDNFGYFSSEAFAASGYKNFGPLVGNANVATGDYFTQMAGTSYQWSYGCGGGSYTSASGIGNTTAFSTASLQGVFTMLFGSYFGDWDSQNNFLRAPLAQGKVLTNVWSGRPHYQFHHMGLGENVGYGLLLTQNNIGNLYFQSPTSITGRWIHNALMGDPTLRNDVVAPVSNVIATKVGYDCHISWSASTETTLVGYNIYMKNDTNNTYIKINALPVAGTTYTDNCLLYKGVYTYMVRAIKLENSPSGTYYNMSEGISDTAFNSSNIKTIAAFSSTLSATTVSFSNVSQNAASQVWSFGNGETSTAANPVITFSVNGTYILTMISINGCYSDTAYGSITIYEVGLSKNSLENFVKFYPNPSGGLITVTSDLVEQLSVRVLNISGQEVFNQELVGKDERLDLSFLTKGVYFIQFKSGEKVLEKKMVLE